MSAAVVGGGDGSESFLASGVPLIPVRRALRRLHGIGGGIAYYLKLHSLAIQLDSPDFLIDVSLLQCRLYAKKGSEQRTKSTPMVDM